MQNALLVISNLTWLHKLWYIFETRQTLKAQSNTQVYGWRRLHGARWGPPSAKNAILNWGPSNTKRNVPMPRIYRLQLAGEPFHRNK
jgi:hypothetical protein